MNDTTRILIVEDNSSDYDLAQYEIGKVVQGCTFKRVEEQNDFLEALQEFQPHIILSDFKLPSFDGIKVLELAQQHSPLSPVIIWTGVMGEEMAVECMKSGASDYILKENVKRLGRATIQALKKREMLLERKQAEEKFQGIFENSPVGIFQSTPQGQFISVNPAMARIYGYDSPQEMISSVIDIAHQIYADPEERRTFRQLLESQDVVQEFEWKNIRKDATIIWTSTSARIVRDSEGNILYYEGFLQDITERKQAEEKLRTSESRYRLATQATKDVIWEWDPTANQLSWTENAQFVFGYSPEEIGPDAAWWDEHIHPDDRERVTSRLNTLTATVGGESDWSDEYRFRLKNGHYAYINDHAYIERDPAGRTIRMIGAMSNITERKRAEEELARNEKRFRALIENGMDSISLLSEDGTLVWENPATFRTLGYEADQFMGNNIFELMHPDDLGWTSDLFAKLVREPGKVQRGTFRLKHHEGTWRWVEATATNMLEEPSVKAIVINYRDITRRREAEEALRDSESKYRALAENSLQGIAIYQGQKIVYANPAMCKINGYTAEELTNMSSDEIIALTHPDDRAMAQERAAKRMAGGPISPDFEGRILRKDGSTVWLHSFNSPIEFDGKPALLSTMLDVTQRKQAERERQALLEIMQGYANTKDLQEFLELVHHSLGNVIYAENFFVVLYRQESKLFEEIYSVDQYDPPAPPSRLEKSITSYVFRSGEPLLLTQESFEELAKQGEIELVGTDSACWLGVPLKTSNRTIGVIAVQDYQDPNRYTDRDKDFLTSIASQIALVVERKQAETSLMESMAQFRALFEASPDAILLIDPNDGSIVDCNTAACRMNGYRREELIGQSIDILGAAPGDPNERAEYMKGIRRQGILHYESTRRRRDGTLIAVDVSTSMIQFGKRDLILGIDRDITARKQADLELKQKNDDLALLNKVNEAVVRGQNLESIIDLLAQELKRIFSTVGSTIYMLTPDKKSLIMQQYSFSPEIAQRVEQLLGFTIPKIEIPIKEGGHFHKAMISRQSAITTDPQEIQNWVAEFAETKFLPSITKAIVRKLIPQIYKLLNIKSTIIVPLIFEEEILGFLDVSSPSLFTTNDLKRIENIAGQLTAVIQRQQASQKIQESEERFRLLFENSGEAVLITQPDGEISSANPEACRMFGRSEQEIRSLGRSGIIDPNDPRLALALEERARTGKFKGELNLLRNDGSIFPGDVSTTIFRDSGGNEKTSMIIRDITERRRAEAAEHEQRVLAEALRDTSQILSGTLDYGEVLDHILTAVGRVVPHDAATITLIDGDIARVVRSQGYDKRASNDEIMGVRLSLAETTNLRLMLETKQPVVIDDTYAYAGWKRMSATDWLRSNVGAPISIYGEIIGFILLDSETPGFFTPAHAERLEAFANQAALAIHNARLLQQAQDEIAERKRAEEELRQSENRYRTVVESQTEFIVRWKPNGVRTFVNDAYCRYYGITPEHALSTGFLPLVYEEDRQAVEEKVSRLLTGISTMETETHRVLKPDGSVGWNEWTDHAIYDENGQLIEFQSVGRDITERKRAEQALRESEALYRQAIEVAGAVPYYQSYSDNGSSITYDFIGEGIRQITGYGPEEFNTKLWDSLVEEVNLVEDLAGYSLDEGIQRVRSGENPVWKCEYRTRARDGKIHWVFEAAVELRDEHGVARGSIGTFQDITTRKQAEAELRASEERFRQLATNIEEAFWMTDARTGQELYISPAAAAIWGNSVENLMKKPESFINSVLAEDREFVLAALERQRKGEKTEIEYRVQRSDGSIGWVWDRAFPIFDERGKVKTLAGIAADVTERKLAEERLRASEERYHSLFQHLVDGFALHEIITDEQGKPVDYRFLEINPAFEKLTGLRAETTIGRRVNEILPRVGNERFISIYGKVALTGEPIHFEEYSAPLGRYYEINAYSPRYGQFAITFEDITERKQAEANLRKLSRAVDQSASTIVITDIQGRIEYVNPKFTEITGYTFEEVIGKNPRILKTGHTSQEEYQELWETIAAGGEWRGEFYNRKKNGDLFWEQVTISPIQNEQGEITHFIAVKEDISQRKQSEIEIQRHLAELEAVYENGLAVGQLLEPRQIGERLIETFARHLSWHHVTIRLLRPETDELELIAFNLPNINKIDKIAVENHFNRLINRVGQGLSGWVVQTGISLRTGQVHTHPQYISTQAGIESGLYMPLKIGDRVIGVISVESETPDAFSEQDERLLATLATQAAIAFENARLYQAAQQEIAERERAQAALRESEAHYRELADSITEIMFELDQNLLYTHWNKASEKFSGIPAQDVIGRSMRDMFGSSEEQTYRETIYRRVLTEQQAQTFETEIFPQGQRRILEINAYPSAHGVTVVARDITERRLSEALQQKRIALMEYSAHHVLDDLMQRAVDEVSELTDSHIGFLHLVETDQKAIHMQAWSSETQKAMDGIEEKEMHYPVESAGIWADAVRQRRPVIHNDYEALPNKKGLPVGHVRVIRELVVPIIRDDRIAGVLGIGNRPRPYDEHDVEITERFADYAWDIIERKQMESALSDERNQLAKRVEERTADLSRANSNLARALRVKDEFLANMSHELRTPLNAILGLSESLSEQVAGPLNEKQQKYLNTINESGHHLLSLINDILDLAKIEAGQITLDINKVDVNSVCQASLRMIKQLAQKKNQEVLFEIDNGLGLMWADERRLKQMIVNLLSNAVKFTPENGRLGLEVHGDQAGNRVLISVWDKGIGISNQDLDRLFKPFVQLDSGLAREATGTGLGLALVAQMARLHGGSVTVDSRMGEGSRFTIQLPWEPALAADVNSRLRTTGKFRAIDIHAKNKPTILLVEDTREVVMMLADYLEMAGFTIATAQDGIDGLEQAKLKHPDLILMDIQMPRMDGFETTQKLRMIPEFKQTPIIALTALAMPNDRQRCLDAGMSEYISKPVNLKMLLKLIRGILYEKEGGPT